MINCEYFVALGVNFSGVSLRIILKRINSRRGFKTAAQDRRIILDIPPSNSDGGISRAGWKGLFFCVAEGVFKGAVGLWRSRALKLIRHLCNAVGFSKDCSLVGIGKLLPDRGASHLLGAL